MRTRWHELAAPFERLAELLEVDDRDLLARVVARCGWGDRTITAPLLPSGVRHGVPWGLSLAMTPEASELRVWLEPQADPPSEAAYRAAGEALFPEHVDRLRALGTPQRWWHQLGFTRGRAVTTRVYACVPDRPELAWAALAARGHDGDTLRRALPARAFATMISTDLDVRARMKLYVLVPDARVDELPLVADDARAFARILNGDAPIGWLVCYGFVPGDAAPSSVALHYGAAVHGDRELPHRLATELARRELADYARVTAVHDAPIHFVAYTQGTRPKITVYWVPEVAR
jgi:hypothetical protein